MTTETLIITLKKEIIQAASDPRFIHHSWYIKYHLEIMEQIAQELCVLYPDANKDMVLTLVWLHDYGKILCSSKQTTIEAGRKKLLEIGFPTDFVEIAIQNVKIIDQKVNLEESSIEVKIVSSADGASHFVGPFHFLWWYENSDKPMDELMKDTISKANQDWNKKIVLSEVKSAFRARYNALLEQAGIFPENYILTGNKIIG